MKIVHTIQDMQAQSAEWRRQGLKIGFVPTMGFLHEGHLSLIRLAREHSDVTVVSIFVNPTQFGPTEDLEQYPRDFERDERLCREEGAAAVFYPTSAAMYSSNHSTWVVEEQLSGPLCGWSRPGHFRGVTTVVAKLFNAVCPDCAVFGQKDAQQALVIQRMVRDLNFPVEIVIGPIVREQDGLAMSSRNSYLTAEQREKALSIHAGLEECRRLFGEGERDAEVLKDAVRSRIEGAAGTVDYVALVSQEALEELQTVDQAALVAVAAYFGKTRLIDNTFLTPPGCGR